MINTARINKLRAGAIALAAGVALSTAMIAQAHGGAGHSGGGYGGGGGHAGGYGGGRGGRGGYGARRGGYGYGRFGYGGFGYGGFGYYGGFGLLEYGLFFDALPLYYSTYWWGGSPYYYANDNFYQWNGVVGQYETVRPPQKLASQVATIPLENVVLFAYPMNGQTDAQQSTDRIECQRWATDQSGVESSPAGSSVPAAASSARRQDYLRAESACLEGRGYSVR